LTETGNAGGREENHHQAGIGQPHRLADGDAGGQDLQGDANKQGRLLKEGKSTAGKG
jgi:hypothetical protein